MRSRPSAIPALALALIVGLAGCGEKSEPETTGPVVPVTTRPDGTQTSSTVTETGGQDGGASPEVLARQAIESFLAAGDPVVCEQFATARFVRDAYGDLRGCEAAQRPASAASSVEITSLSVQGGSASAAAIPRGGTNDGEELRIELIGQGDSWLIDSLESNSPVGP